MLRLAVLFLAAGFASAVHVDLPEPYTDYCILQNNTNRYDPQNQFAIPWFNVDLDLPPSQRWVEITKQYKPQIQELIGVIINIVEPVFPDAREIVDLLCGDLEQRLPEPYRDEIASIAQVAEMPVGEIVLYNIFYEIFTVCTSVIAVDNNGVQYHARNLDFGLFLGWNYTVHEWPISQHLRNMIININWIKNGQVLYKSNNFAGFVGIYNGLKQNMFTLTADERFQGAGGYVGIYRWLMGLEPNGKFMTWLARETLETANSYAEAQVTLMNQPMLSPVYWILGGVKAFDGCIIARSLNHTALLTSMNQYDPIGWYLLETNYDQDKPTLYLDDRRTPGNHCMQVMGRNRAGFEGIYNVLSSRTNLNKLTTYTVLMQVSNGRFETHLQSCPGYCWAF